MLVRQEGNRQVKRNIDHYNLDIIIALGYHPRDGNTKMFFATTKQVTLCRSREYSRRNNLSPGIATTRKKRTIFTLAKMRKIILFLIFENYIVFIQHNNFNMNYGLLYCQKSPTI